MPICPVCLTETLPPIGSKNSKILLIGSTPHKEALENGITFGDRATKEVLSNEFFTFGYDYYNMRRIYLWQHAPNGDSNCFQEGFRNVLDEAKGREAILLLGAESVEHFTGYSVSEVSGLQVTSNMLSAPTIFAMLDVKTIFQDGIGEIRFALRNFVEAIRKEGIL